VIAIDTSYDWVAVSPVGAGLGLALGVIEGGGLLVPWPEVVGVEEAVEGAETPLALVPPLNVDVVPFAAEDAVLAADEVTEVVELVVDGLVELPNGLCAAPFRFE
jgi:hypothetical protein